MRRSLLLSLAALACSDGGVAEPAASPIVASKVAVLAVGVATAPEGRSFFDNFLPCPRRGVIDYRNTPQGRQATFTGCDAGDGVIVDGTAEVRWTGAQADSGRIERIEVVGRLTVRTAEDRSAVDVVERLVVEGIAFATPDEPAVETLVVGPVRVTVAGESTPLHPLATPERVFGPALTIGSIPNPAGGLDALTEADVKRIAYHGAMALASTLFNETLEIQRGAHVHAAPCGTMRVTPDVARNLPRLDVAWDACDARHGLFVGGTFAAEWTAFDFDAGRVAMVVDGPLTFGGGVPTITLSRLEWTVTGLGEFPATIRIAGRLVSGAQQRTYAFDLVVDD